MMKNVPVSSRFGGYEYERLGPNTARLVLCFGRFGSCSSESDERWTIDLEFISPDAAKYTDHDSP